MSLFLMWLAFTGAGALFYRIGGTSIGTKWRDIGVPIVFLAYLLKLGAIAGLWQWVSVVIAFGAMWGALTTYCYFLSKPKNYLWYHYAQHGFFISLAAFPYAIATGKWLGFSIRVAVCTIGLGLWSFTKTDWIEEGGRGAIIIGSTPLLLI